MNTPAIFMFIFLSYSLSAAAQSNEQLFLQAYDIELDAGDPRRAAALYEQIARADDSPVSALTQRARFRLGVCRHKIGELEPARQLLTRLLAEEGLEQGLAEQVRRELVALLGELEQVRITGVVRDALGRPTPGAVIFAGDWGYEPIVIAGSNGEFAVERRASGEDAFGYRYVMIYAEHPEREESVVTVVTFTADKQPAIDINLARAIVLNGCVTDSRGNPLADANVTVKAFWAGADPDRTAPYVPLERLMRWPTTDRQGRFVIAPVPRGVRLVIGAERAGYVLRSPGAWEPGQGMPAGDGRFADLTPLVMDVADSGALAGTVTGENGAPVQARVRILTMPPEMREVTVARTGDDGHFTIAGVPEGRYMIRAEALTGRFAWRGLAGVNAGIPARLDFVLIAAPVVEGSAGVGEKAPPVSAMSVNSTPLSLAAAAGEVVLIGFWNRWTSSEPPAFLADFQRRYGGRGLRVWCIHDHSGLPGDLSHSAARNLAEYVLAIDQYAPTLPEAMNSLTMARCGMRGGDGILVDKQGLIAFAGPLTGSNVAVVLDEKVRSALAIADVGAVDRGDKNATAKGGLPDLSNVQWISGEAQPVIPDWRGAIAVIHFSSSYFDAHVRRQFPGEASQIDTIARRFGRHGVEAAWLLPDGDDLKAGDPVLRAMAPALAVGVDRGRLVYQALRVRAEGVNVVIGRDGRVIAVDVPDSRLWRLLADLVRSERAGHGAK